MIKIQMSKFTANEGWVLRWKRNFCFCRCKVFLHLQKNFRMSFLVRILTTTLAILLVTKLMPGVSVNSVTTAIILSLVLAVLNVFVKPILIFFTLPITVFTLGLFLLVINALIILIASNLVDGFKVNGFWSALFFSIVLSLTISLFDKLNERSQSKEN